MILKTKIQNLSINKQSNSLSTDVNENYSKATYNKKGNITFINIDKALNDKNEVGFTKTYTQNLVKKYDLTGNKEVCFRKIFIAKREDGLFDITIRESNIYYRKSKKFDFKKVVRFKSPVGSIEYIFEKLKFNEKKEIELKSFNLLN